MLLTCRVCSGSALLTLRLASGVVPTGETSCIHHMYREYIYKYTIRELIIPKRLPILLHLPLEWHVSARISAPLSGCPVNMGYCL